AHDERFNAMVNSIALNTTSKDPVEAATGSDRLMSSHIGPVVDSIDGAPNEPEADAQQTSQQMALFSLSEWQEAIYARIVEKVGTRTYWEDWAHDVADIASALISRIEAILDDADDTMTQGFAAFVQGLQDSLN